MSADPRVEDARRHYQAIHGEKPPVTPEESNSRNNGTPSDHPYDSIMEGADLGVADVFDGIMKDAEAEEDAQYSEEDVIADGGYEMAMPIGGMPSYTETNNDSEEYVGDFSL